MNGQPRVRSRLARLTSQTTCSNRFRPHVFTSRNSALTSWSGPAQMGDLGCDGWGNVPRLSDRSWRILVDGHTNGGTWTTTGSNLNSWSGLSQITCSGCRHGTILPMAYVPGSTPAYRDSGKCLDVGSGDGADVQRCTCGGVKRQWSRTRT